MDEPAIKSFDRQPITINKMNRVFRVTVRLVIPRFLGGSMTVFVSRNFGSSATALVGAIAIGGSLIVVSPADYRVMAQRVEIAAVQLQSQVTSILQNTAVPIPSAVAAVKPVASATALATGAPDIGAIIGPIILTILLSPILLVTAPIWIPLGVIGILSLATFFARIDCGLGCAVTSKTVPAAASVGLNAAEAVPTVAAPKRVSQTRRTKTKSAAATLSMGSNSKKVPAASVKRAARSAAAKAARNVN